MDITGFAELALPYIGPLLGVLLGHYLALRGEKLKIDLEERSKEKRVFEKIFYSLNVKTSFLVNTIDLIEEIEADSSHDLKFIAFRAETLEKLLNTHFRDFRTTLGNFVTYNGLAICPPTKHTHKFVNTVSKIMVYLDIFENSGLKNITHDYLRHTPVHELNILIVEMSGDINKYYRIENRGIISFFRKKWVLLKEVRMNVKDSRKG